MFNFEIKNASSDKIKQMMDFMDENLKEHEKPKVGIFWYSPRIHDLFGVVAIDTDIQIEKEQRDMVSCKELHKYVWKKQYNYYKYHGGSDLFKGDYKDTPRGRVFYCQSQDTYIVMVGSWIEQYPEVIDLVKIEFNLENENVIIEKGEHWEIGMGYGE
ncbi:MAG: hypothetical protein [Wendovervirus sonii]|uniref:Uncharacterized protein n=1 Tax=phage Lak_Megaphage_Sonny TaxID=3109229 RepID=A0ABZ0Z502_9CAUD|nr:MAG: hypothetical protein [phage Lak_Megaphage_Sonny]